MQLARELAALDQLCAGRLDVGVGLGRHQPDLVALGYPDDRPLRRLREGVEVMRALWTQARATYEGEIWHFADRSVEPKPVQQPHPPVWFGVGGPRGLRLAARLGDAWIGAGSSSTAQFLERVAILRHELAVAGRDVASFPVAKRIYVAVADSVERARSELAPVLDGQYGMPGLTERIAVYGPPEHVAEGIRAVLDGGARQVVLNPVHDPEGQLDAVTELARQLSAH